MPAAIVLPASHLVAVVGGSLCEAVLAQELVVVNMWR